jgi:phosphoglycerate kinase
MKTIKDLNIENKKVILRLDLNVPIQNGEIKDNNRIKASLETINYLIKNNAKIIIMSHLGKIKTEEDKQNNTLKPVKNELEKLLNKTINYSSILKGKELEEKINNLKMGEILLLENTRHMDYPDKLESNCDEELSKYWASLGDVFILDAFGSSHRAHASTYGISKYLPHGIGFLIEKEINELNKIKKENKTLILGGSKVSDKIGIIKNLLETSNKVLIGGAMCGTFLKSLGYEVGKTFVESDKIEEVKELLNKDKIILPEDVVTENGIKNIKEITENESILDIGPITISIFESEIHSNELVLMNGTMGKYEEEKYSNGTKAIFKILKEMNTKTIICGGDTGNAAKQFNFTPTYLSTGGGASLEYLEGKELPALKIMEE